MRGHAAVSLLVAASAACTSTSETNAGEQLPCDVAEILHDSCQPCHGSPPAAGVPLSLVSYADTQAPYTSEPLYHDAPAWQVMGDMVQAGMMPEPPVTLGEEDRETLLGWIDDGAPPAPEGSECP